MAALVRVGHKGADAIVPGNTLASFDAALAAGVQMIEFDVIAVGGPPAELYVAHDPGALRERAAGGPGQGAPTLAAALAHLSGPAFDGVRLQVDLKGPGYVEPVIAALRGAGVIERTFISTGMRSNLEAIRALEPGLRLGWTVPGIPGVSGTPLLTPTLGRVYRALLPGRAAARIRSGSVDALVAQWRLITPALVAAVSSAGGELYAWTVDDAAQIRRLAALGVSGVITNDPRLFDAA
jgi:glycerophosphoryl diester phosphodiesterase